MKVYEVKRIPTGNSVLVLRGKYEAIRNLMFDAIKEDPKNEEVIRRDMQTHYLRFNGMLRELVKEVTGEECERVLGHAYDNLTSYIIIFPVKYTGKIYTAGYDWDKRLHFIELK